MTIKTTILILRPRVSLTHFFIRLMTLQSIADDVTMTRWIVISNSLDIDFIHGDIHDRSCKKITLPIFDITMDYVGSYQYRWTLHTNGRFPYWAKWRHDASWNPVPYAMSNIANNKSDNTRERGSESSGKYEPKYRLYKHISNVITRQVPTNDQKVIRS